MLLWRRFFLDRHLNDNTNDDKLPGCRGLTATPYSVQSRTRGGSRKRLGVRRDSVWQPGGGGGPGEASGGRIGISGPPGGDL